MVIQFGLFKNHIKKRGVQRRQEKYHVRSSDVVLWLLQGGRAFLMPSRAISRTFPLKLPS